MNCTIRLTPHFFKELKRLAKWHRLLEKDLQVFQQSLRENPWQGVELGNGLRKVRMAITSKGKGKRGGARVITFTAVLSIENMEVVLVTIYDKSEQETISDKELMRLREENGL